MSSSNLINNYDSRNFNKSIIYKNYISSAQTSREKYKNKPKKININKFITKVLCYEQKRNLNLEQKRFQKIMEEKSSLSEKPNLNLTSRYIPNSNSYQNDPFFLKVTEAIKKKKKQFSELNKNNSLEGSKLNNKSEIVNKKNIKRTLSSKQIKTFIRNQEIWQKKINEKKDFKKKELRKLNNDIINSNIHPPKTNRTYREEKNKHNYNELINDLYAQNKAINMKKKYLQDKYSYEFKPKINNNIKYKNISSKYNKNIINYKKKKNKYHNLSVDESYLKDKNKKFNEGVENMKMKYRNYNNLKNVDNKKINNSMETKHWSDLLETINKNKKTNDNIYYLNINQSTPWNKYMINNVPYEEKNEEIINMFVDSNI